MVGYARRQGKLAGNQETNRSTLPPPNTGTIYMNEYMDMIEKGNDSDIYSEIIVKVVKTNPGAFFSYLRKTSPERRNTMEKIVAESDQ